MQMEVGWRRRVPSGVCRLFGPFSGGFYYGALGSMGADAEDE